jgi:hypothetical protein
MSNRGPYATNYVYIDREPGLLGSAWWLASIVLIVDKPVGLLFNERTLGLDWWELPMGIVAWALYSLWRVADTHMWHSELAHALLASWFYQRYPTEEDVRVGDYFQR